VEVLVRAALSNAAVVAVLAAAVLAVDRLARRPALSHRLWLLLLIKLVTPPLVAMPWDRTRPEPGRPVVPSAPESRPAPAPVRRQAEAQPAGVPARFTATPLNLRW
jgi:hypothetical protein